MSRRALQKDTTADEELRACITAQPPQSFIMVAGAGSGKTTSLIKGLTAILDVHGEKLRLRRQRVACITYTEIAAGEIWADVGNNPLVHVATIHSFLWSVIRTFQSDIQDWVEARIDSKLLELREAAANFGARVQQRTKDKNLRDIARYEQQKEKIGRVRTFTYGTGSDYPKGTLGHDDIIKMVPQLLSERPLLRTLVAQQFPFIFVDESQDTAESVVAALKAIDLQNGDNFCVGFFGDPMQRIYPTGIGIIPSEAGWRNITKPENFRCPTTVLSVANAIRRDGDGLVQTRGRMIERDGEQIGVAGSAHIFILPADDRRQERLGQVRAWASRLHQDIAWQDDRGDSAPKLLVIVHRMAATRLGFGDLYAALNDKAPDGFKSGFLDASAWPVRPFLSFVLPLAEAKNNGREFEVIQLLRSQSPLLDRAKLSQVDMASRLAQLGELVGEITQLMAASSNATNAQVLTRLHQSGLYDLDARLLSYLNLAPAPAAATDGESSTEKDEDDGEELSREIAAVEAFLACPAKQFWGYQTYINEESPFSTQQGIKGAEFDRVLVVLDDEEGTHVQFSYEKYLGIKPPSDRDMANQSDGKETAVDRTRRLFYVCCTRALKDLLVVLFTPDPDAAERQFRSLDIFPAEAIHSKEDLSGVN